MNIKNITKEEARKFYESLSEERLIKMLLESNDFTSARSNDYDKCENDESNLKK